MIPEKLRGQAHINLLEFIAQLVGIWIDVLEGRITHMQCLLAIGDSTSAMGWLRRSNFRASDEESHDWIAKQRVARKLASLVLTSGTVLYSQWLEGDMNIVADSLSRDGYILSPVTHKNLLTSLVPSQLPPNFQVLPVPGEINSFISSILQQLPVRQQRWKAPKPSKLVLGINGSVSCSVLNGQSHFTWTGCPSSSAIISCLPLHKQCEKAPSLLDLVSLWKAQSMPPSHMWLRPSNQTRGLTPDWTKMETSASS